MNARSLGLERVLNWVLMAAGFVLAAVSLAVGWDIRNVVAYAAIALMLSANIPYVVNAVKGKTEPHVVTWVLLGLITGLAFLKQLQLGAPPSKVYPLGAAAAMNFINCFAGRKRATYSIAPSDVACGLVALLAVGLWRWVDDPLWTVVFLTIASLLAFIPTFRKSRDNPNSETLVTYQRNTVRYLLITLAVVPFTLATVLYPATWVAVNGWFSLYLPLKRRQLAVELAAVT